MKNTVLHTKTTFSKSLNWILYIKNYEIQRKRCLSSTYNNLYHYAGNSPVCYTDPTGRNDETNLLNDFFQSFDVKIGLQEKLSFNIPNVASLDVEIDFGSFNYEDDGTTMSQGLTLNTSLGADDFPAVSLSLGVERTLPADNACAFDLVNLMDQEFQTVADTKVNEDVTVTTPFPFISVTLNITKFANFLSNAFNAIENEFKEGKNEK